MPPIKEFPAFTPLIKFTIGNLVEILGTELHGAAKHLPKVFYNHDVITLENWMNDIGIEASRADFFSDGVHPSELTYQIWAKDMANWIINEKKITFD
ncbi:MAG: hypothetical protein KI790_05175 [Cyclobacteriaceae bacterium]|nr:hypothetical protein [Cyclobacteriaceae bacterium HetDA_MAG_MS6]